MNISSYAVVSYTNRKKSEIKYREQKHSCMLCNLEEMTGIKEYLMERFLQVVNIVDCPEVYCVYQKCSIITSECGDMSYLLGKAKTSLFFLAGLPAMK